jgi:hypothetical protein
MVFVAEAFSGWLAAQFADVARRQLGEWLVGSDQQRALGQAATAAIQATSKQLRPAPLTTDDVDGAEHLERVIDEVFQQPPTPAESLAEHPTLLEGLQAGVAARLAPLGDADVTGTPHSSAEILGVSVRSLTDLLTARLLQEILARGSSGGPLAPLADQLNHDLTHLQGQQHNAGLTRLSTDQQTMLTILQRLDQKARPIPPSTAGELVQHCWVDEVTGWLPRVSDVTDPVTLGVHPCMTLDEHGPDGKKSGSLDKVPMYVPRDIDAVLDEKWVPGTFVLLVGDSTAGKSRTAFEAMCRVAANQWLLVPAERGSLRALLDTGFNFRDTVVWLDDLERYLGHRGLDTALLRRLLNDPARKVMILATIRAKEYSSLSRGPDSGRADADSSLLRTARQLLDQVTVRIDLARRLTPGEEQRARERRRDPRVAEALAHSDRYGLAEYLAAAPKLLNEWRDAWAVTNQPAGAALVAAAVDCRRAGFQGSLAASMLCDLAASYLDPAVTGSLEPTAFQDGLAWAARPRYGASALLGRQADGSYLPFDYLVDSVQRDPNASPIPHHVWRRLLEIPQPASELAMIASMARWSAGEAAIAEQAFRLVAEANDDNLNRTAYESIAELAGSRGDLDEAASWRRKLYRYTWYAVDSLELLAIRGSAAALVNLGELADANDMLAMDALGKMAERGSTAALRILRNLADADHPDIVEKVGFLAASRGDMAEVIACYYKLADGTNKRSARYWLELATSHLTLRKSGSREILELQELAQAGEPQAREILDRLAKSAEGGRT